MSIGTNDLTQYTMAADRLLGSVASYQDPWHPAVLRMIKSIGDAGRALGKPVGICGEAAADPLLAVVLVGLGATDLSMTAAALADVRAELLRHTLAEASTWPLSPSTPPVRPTRARVVSAAALVALDSPRRTQSTSAVSAPLRAATLGRRVDASRSLERRRPLRLSPHDRLLDLLDRLGDLDAARARIRAVERRAAAPHALFVVEDVEAHLRRVVARVEDEAVRVHDRGRAEVLSVGPEDRAATTCTQRTGCTWSCRRSGRDR